MDPRLCPTSYSFEEIKRTVNFVLSRTEIRPMIGIICGSGLGSLADSITEQEIIRYDEIPYFPVSTVPGHAGQFVFGKIGITFVVAMQGRFHHYEGYTLLKCTMPVRIMHLIGVRYLFATNAAGGVNPEFNLGDIMFIRDHINFMGLPGNNPLNGPNLPQLGPRFLSMTNAYDKGMRDLARKVGIEMGIEEIMREGVYACLGGPTYESIAELIMLHTMGVDAVGMSTAHEIIIARHCGMTVFALSLITNKCALDYEDREPANHEEVIKIAKSRETTCCEFIARLVNEVQLIETKIAEEAAAEEAKKEAEAEKIKQEEEAEKKKEEQKNEKNKKRTFKKK
ncbi:purine nucleoside phosphorylase-like [Teleopsis dalmanni]|uniref:purine nucleoside phosphorylase-like n=1 Tax=Teleopsis dalmanni TaxID=139649 RepID=UPI0018CFD278|nr:purine nucleoside phosphorylase-like [Teleopsis dalmanni]XP_037959801.1 purine nucleoside phosphorylase-like [Teleopsis dalmanni]